MAEYDLAYILLGADNITVCNYKSSLHMISSYLQCVCAAQLLLLGDIACAHVPCLSIAEVVANCFSTMANDEYKIVDTCSSQTDKQVFQYWFVCKWDHHLRPGVGERMHPHAFSGREYHCVHIAP